MLSWELHATFVELHPLWSITPDPWALHPIRTGAMLTDRVHGLIGDKLRRGYTSGAARPPANRSDTTHHFTDPWPLTWSSPTRSRHQAAMTLVSK